MKPQLISFENHVGCLKLHIDTEPKLRLAYSKKTLKGVKIRGSYYPFGLKHKGYNNVINGTDHPYGFGGNEEQDELGLGWIDITARNYNPELGRWMNLDPLAEQMRRHSPYNYAFDNPVFFIDPDGMMPCEPGDDCYEDSSEPDKPSSNGVVDALLQKTADGLEIAVNTLINLFSGLNGITDGDTKETIGSGVVVVGNGEITDSNTTSENPSDDIYIDEDIITALTSITGKHKGKGKNPAETLQNGMKDTKKVMRIVDKVDDLISGGDNKGSMSTTNTDGEVSTNKKGFTFSIVAEDTKMTRDSTGRYITTKRKDTTVNNTMKDKIYAEIRSNVRWQRKVDSIKQSGS